MTRKVEFQVEAEEVDIEVLWKAITKDKIEFLHKTYPDLQVNAQVLETGVANSIGIGTLLLYSFGPGTTSSNIPPYKERIVELDESKHLISFKGEEGGYLKLGLAHFLFSIKLDETGSGKISITATLIYDFDEGFDGTELVEDSSLKIRNYIVNLVNHLKVNK